MLVNIKSDILVLYYKQVRMQPAVFWSNHFFPFNWYSSLQPRNNVFDSEMLHYIDKQTSTGFVSDYKSTAYLHSIQDILLKIVAWI